MVKKYVVKAKKQVSSKIRLIILSVSSCNSALVVLPVMPAVVAPCDVGFFFFTRRVSGV